ncbi:IS110 family transposase [Paraburkholderia terrae]|jgi:transposase|uniref:IS110 family transposase n=1 Tax=Paraburkholderia terrae TaxID=311230 RepID=UPI00200A4EE0|nr:IS110 family transposase [Paraburkholderia terrae]BDC45512.1 putative family 20 transposase [Paraburkholderia terrae]
MEIDLLGIDLAKRVFQLHGADRRGRAIYRNKVSRAALIETVRNLRPRTIAMEACGSAHHWARCFEGAGFEVRLISPHYVTPFVKTNKNDRNDAEAIVEAASRPSMNFVTVKSVEQQDMQAAHRVRELLVQQRTAIINQARGLLGERGLAIAQSPAAFRKAIPQILGETEGELTSFCRSLIMTLVQRLRALEEEIVVAEGWIRSFMNRSALCQKIATVPGIGPVTATAIVAAVGRADGFRNGRHLAAWLGLVPRQHSSGGKSQLFGISKRGDRYLRTLLIHGARSVLIRVSGKHDARSRWLQELIARRGYNRACVALANKNARIIQVLLSTEATYKPAAQTDS